MGVLEGLVESGEKNKTYKKELSPTKNKQKRKTKDSVKAKNPHGLGTRG